MEKLSVNTIPIIDTTNTYEKKILSGEKVPFYSCSKERKWKNVFFSKLKVQFLQIEWGAVPEER